MLLRKNDPRSVLRSKDTSMVPQNYISEPVVSTIRGRQARGSVSKAVSASYFVKNEDADVYKLENLLTAGVRPSDVTRPYFSPSIDDVAEMSRRMEYEEVHVPTSEPTSEPNQNNE